MVTPISSFDRSAPPSSFAPWHRSYLPAPFADPAARPSELLAAGEAEIAKLTVQIKDIEQQQKEGRALKEALEHRGFLARIRLCVLLNALLDRGLLVLRDCFDIEGYLACKHWPGERIRMAQLHNYLKIARHLPRALIESERFSLNVKVQIAEVQDPACIDLLSGLLLDGDKSRERIKRGAAWAAAARRAGQPCDKIREAALAGINMKRPRQGKGPSTLEALEADLLAVLVKHLGRGMDCGQMEQGLRDTSMSQLLERARGAAGPPPQDRRRTERDAAPADPIKEGPPAKPVYEPAAPPAPEVQAPAKPVYEGPSRVEPPANKEPEQEEEKKEEMDDETWWKRLTSAVTGVLAPEELDTLSDLLFVALAGEQPIRLITFLRGAAVPRLAPAPAVVQQDLQLWLRQVSHWDLLRRWHPLYNFFVMAQPPRFRIRLHALGEVPLPEPLWPILERAWAYWPLDLSPPPDIPADADEQQVERFQALHRFDLAVGALQHIVLRPGEVTVSLAAAVWEATMEFKQGLEELARCLPDYPELKELFR